MPDAAPPPPLALAPDGLTRGSRPQAGVSVGVDIGGTRIKVGVCDADFRILARASGPTPPDHAPDEVVQAVVQLVAEAMRDAGYEDAWPAAIGVGVPGRVEPGSGTVLGAANLSGWRDVPLGGLLAKATGVPVAVHNDANVAAFGEFTIASREKHHPQSIALLTLGTGVGGGIVLAGRLVVGANQMAGEVGHMIVQPGGLPCPCGQVGCLERYAAAPAIVQAYLREAGLVDPNPGPTPASILALADAGDAPAQRALNEAAGFLAVACINLTRLLDLDAIILGGGLVEAGDGLIARTRAKFKGLDWSIPTTPPRILRAVLGNDAGWIGAAALSTNLVR